MTLLTPRQPLRPVRFACYLLVCLLASACANNSTNDSAYKYLFNRDVISNQPMKVLIAPENFGVPSKSYLQEYESKVDYAVAERLKDAGHTVINNRVFETAWRRAIRKFGSPYDASGANINAVTFQQIVAQSIKAVRDETDADIIIFTDLIEPLVVFGGQGSRRAKWHGVSRNLRVKGGSQVSASFDWSQTVPATSLHIIAYSRNGELVLKNIGGLEVVKQLDALRARFARRDKLFSSTKNLEQGVRIALNPLVPFEM